jgi:hypothetical protein
MTMSSLTKNREAWRYIGRFMWAFAGGSPAASSSLVASTKSRRQRISKTRNSAHHDPMLIVGPPAAHIDRQRRW